jgi:hypothetical protein
VAIHPDITLCKVADLVLGIVLVLLLVIVIVIVIAIKDVGQGSRVPERGFRSTENQRFLLEGVRLFLSITITITSCHETGVSLANDENVRCTPFRVAESLVQSPG